MKFRVKLSSRGLCLAYGETIGSVINRAGGFSPDAFPEAIRFTSDATRDQQLASARKLIAFSAGASKSAIHHLASETSAVPTTVTIPTVW